ncbi:hypothetical protein [Longirhabdus pacifica]|uniref:hypothetical protein n=1 Tax=Longirhabdus pacifica TaxID=2305227 RepID=UPI0010089009|nr:hypothetical protein [Longirhabdus pacifica]
MKKLAVVMVGGAIVFSSLSASAFADTSMLESKVNTVVPAVVETVSLDHSMDTVQTFDDIAKAEELANIVSNEDMKKLETLYNEALQLETSGDEDAGDMKWQAFDSILDNYFTPTFADFAKAEELAEVVSDGDMKKLEALYNEALQLQKLDEDAANKKWQAFDSIIDNYFTPPTFADFAKAEELAEVVSDGDMKKLEALYNEALQLQKSDEDVANKKWQAFDSILDNYFPDEDDQDDVNDDTKK